MATRTSAEKDKQDAIPIQMLTPEELRGRVRIHKTTLTWPAADAAGTTLTGSNLPKGAKIVGGFIVSQAGAASSTLQVAINAVNLSAAITLGAATMRTELPDKDNWHNVVGVDFGGYPPVITTAGGAMVSGNKIALILFYVVD